MNLNDFRRYAHEMADKLADYFENIQHFPVKSTVSPGEIFSALPKSPPENSESWDHIIDDFDQIIFPGITHWQSPDFYAFFPANSSYPSLLGEFLTAGLGAQCMLWETSPAAAELEEKMMNWLAEMTGLPENFQGVIQDSASTSTLVAILTAREKISNFLINNEGIKQNLYRVYCSQEAHSSVDKAVKIAGIGKNNLIKIEVDNELAMIPGKLEEAISNDLKKGLIPVCVVAALGSTGTTAVDPLKSISKICKKFNIWLHVDAAYAGTAFILDEYRYMLEGIENADSYVFNPHKWMFTNFDCSAYFVKDSDLLKRTFEIFPEYLKTGTDSVVNNYRDWGIQLGRRFRALKLWFVIRSFGVNGIKSRISDHIEWAGWLAKEIDQSPSFELLKPQRFGLVCFRLKPDNLSDKDELNKLNQYFLEKLNSSGKMYLSHTKVKGNFILRMVIGQTYTSFENIERSWSLIKNTGISLINNYK